MKIDELEAIVEFIYGGNLFIVIFILLISYLIFRNKLNLSKFKFFADFCAIAIFVFSIDIMIAPHRYQFIANAILHFRNEDTVEYYDDGSYQKVNYVNGKLQGAAQFSLKDGYIEDFQYVDGIKSGKSIIHYKDGSYETRNYVNGIPNGESVLYFYTGISMKRNYVNGEIQGLVQFFTKDGFKLEDSNYVDGKANGEAIKYFLDGGYEKSNYVNGTLQGIAQRFSKDGIKIEEFKYVDGVRSNL